MNVSIDIIYVLNDVETPQSSLHKLFMVSAVDTGFSKGGVPITFEY